MSEPQQIRVGQVWRSRDRREPSMTARVVAVEGDGLYDNGFVVLQRCVRTRARYSTLRTRYRLERDVTS